MNNNVFSLLIFAIFCCAIPRQGECNVGKIANSDSIKTLMAAMEYVDQMITNGNDTDDMDMEEIRKSISEMIKPGKDAVIIRNGELRLNCNNFCIQRKRRRDCITFPRRRICHICRSIRCPIRRRGSKIF